MKIKVFAAIFTIIAGIAASNVCDEPLLPTCSNDKIPKKFPESKEDLQIFCVPTLAFFECGEKYVKTCNLDPKIYGEFSAVLGVLQEVCNQDTLLHSAFVDNLSCFSDLAKGKYEDECFQEMISLTMETLNQTIEALTENGLITDIYNEETLINTYRCLRSFHHYACYGDILERKCGTIALEAFVEIVLKLGPSLNDECKELFDLFPALIRLDKLEKTEEETDIISEIFTRRK